MKSGRVSKEGATLAPVSYSSECSFFDSYKFECLRPTWKKYFATISATEEIILVCWACIEIEEPFDFKKSDSAERLQFLFLSAAKAKKCKLSSLAVFLKIHYF